MAFTGRSYLTMSKIRSFGQISAINRAFKPQSCHVSYCTHNDSKNRKLYEHHIPTNGFQKGLLAIGSSVMSLVNPWRGDMIAVSGETMGQPALTSMMYQMRQSEEGRKILMDQPLIDSSTLEPLHLLPEDSFGYVFQQFMARNQISPDDRREVRFVDDPDLAYVMTRYRQIHDIVHCLCEMDTHMLGEVAIKWVESIQTNLPMTWGAATLGAMRLSPKQRVMYQQSVLPWAIKCGHEASPFINVYFEKRWQQNFVQLQQELNITQPIPVVPKRKPVVTS